MKTRFHTISVALAAALACGLALAQTATPSTAERDRATTAINAKRATMGLPRLTRPPVARDCSVEKQCPNGTKVSCSVAGNFTDCGGKYNENGVLTGVTCMAYKSTDGTAGAIAANQSSCG